MDYEVPDEFQNDLKHAVQLLKASGCREVYLFGSLLRGEPNAASDLDLGIRGFPQEQFFALYGKLMAELSRPVDLVDFDTEKDFFHLLSRIREVRRVA